MAKIIVVTLFLLLILSACSRETSESFVCSDPAGCVILAPGEPVRIVAMHVLSGELALSGEENINTVKLAAASKDHFIYGHPIQIIAEDSQCTRQGGLVMAQKTVSDPRVVAVHGTTCSVSSVPAADIISAAGLTMISGSATSPYLTSPNGHKGKYWQPGFFRTAPNDKYQGYATADFVHNKLGFTRAATINDEDTYSRTLTSLFESEFQRLGGEIVFSGAVSKKDRDMGPILEAVDRSKAQVLFFPVFPPQGDYLVNQARHSDSLQNIALVSGDGLMNDAFIKRIGNNAQGMYFVVPRHIKCARSRDLQDRYAAAFGRSIGGVFYAHHYDAALILFDAIENTAFRIEDGSLVIGRQALRDEIRFLKNFQGLTGNLACDAYGDCGVPRYKLVRVDNPEDDFEGISENIISVYEIDNTGNMPQQE